MPTKPSSIKKNAGKTPNESNKSVVGKTGGFVGNSRFAQRGNHLLAAAAHNTRSSAAKKTQAPIAIVDAVLEKTDELLVVATSDEDDEEKSIGEACDTFSSDDDETTLEVFDALGSEKQTSPELLKENNAHQVLDEMPKSKPEAKKSFAQLFKDVKTNSIDFKLEYKCTGDLLEDLELGEDDVEDTQKAWGHSIIGYIAGKNPSYKAIIGFCKSWTPKCHVEFDNSGWMVVKFERVEDMRRVLEGGPYLIYNKPFVIKEMPRFFNFDKSEICKAQVWVTLPHLPKECWNEKALSKIGSRVGVPIQMDSITASKERSSFARILIEVDLSKKLEDSVVIKLPKGKTITQVVEYEYLPTFCEECNAIGHDTKICARRKQQMEEARKAKEATKELVGAPAKENVPDVQTSKVTSTLQTVSTTSKFDASSSKPSKEAILEDKCEEKEFTPVLSKNQKRALARAKKGWVKKKINVVDIVDKGKGKLDEDPCVVVVVGNEVVVNTEATKGTRDQEKGGAPPRSSQ